MSRLRVGVLASGRGSNLQALIEAGNDPLYPGRVVTVCANRDCAALELAKKASISRDIFRLANFPDRKTRDLAMAKTLRMHDVELVVCAGYDAILERAFTRQFEGRIINIHPSLLPEFAGTMDAVAMALQAGVTETGGTERGLREASIPVHALQELTGFPELLDGRVKTLHPNVHAGILARRDEPRHLQELADRELKLIDLVVVNLYPFMETVSAGADRAQTIESIDIGGVTLLRAAAKNHDHVLPVVRPSDYPAVLSALKNPGGVPASLRRHLAAVAFGHTAAYDAAIGEHLRGPNAATTLPQ